MQVKVTDWDMVTGAVVGEEPKVTDPEVPESIVAGALVWVVTVEVTEPAVLRLVRPVNER